MDGHRARNIPFVWPRRRSPARVAEVEVDAARLPQTASILADHQAAEHRRSMIQQPEDHPRQRKLFGSCRKPTQAEPGNSSPTNVYSKLSLNYESVTASLLSRNPFKGTSISRASLGQKSSKQSLKSPNASEFRFDGLLSAEMDPSVRKRSLSSTMRQSTQDSPSACHVALTSLLEIPVPDLSPHQTVPSTAFSFGVTPENTCTINVNSAGQRHSLSVFSHQQEVAPTEASEIKRQYQERIRSTEPTLQGSSTGFHLQSKAAWSIFKRRRQSTPSRPKSIAVSSSSDMFSRGLSPTQSVFSRSSSDSSWLRMSPRDATLPPGSNMSFSSALSQPSSVRSSWNSRSSDSLGDSPSLCGTPIDYEGELMWYHGGSNGHDSQQRTLTPPFRLIMSDSDEDEEDDYDNFNYHDGCPSSKWSDWSDHLDPTDSDHVGPSTHALIKKTSALFENLFV